MEVAIARPEVIALNEAERITRNIMIGGNLPSSFKPELLAFMDVNIKNIRNEVLDEVIEAIRNEDVDAESTNDEGDGAYNRRGEDDITAIEALRDKEDER
jgi:hypothetical protein